MASSGGGPVWTSFTPGLTQAGAVAATVNHARYMTIGKLAIVEILLTATAAGVAGNAIGITGIPAAIAPARTGLSAPCGVFQAVEVGVTYKVGNAFFNSSTEVRGLIHGSGGAGIGQNPSFALANTGTVSCKIAYEMA